MGATNKTAFERDIQKIADLNKMTYDHVKYRWDLYGWLYMDNKIITPPNLQDFQKYYLLLPKGGTCMCSTCKKGF
jgi:hypothetical protein